MLTNNCLVQDWTRGFFSNSCNIFEFWNIYSQVEFQMYLKILSENQQSFQKKSTGKYNYVFLILLDCKDK